MKEIVDRLHESRQIERAKEILESAGYTFTRLKESEDRFFDAKYDVNGFQTDNPGEAIKKWFEMQQKDKFNVAISSYKDDAFPLIQWASEHTQDIKKWHSQYHCPYKLDHLLSSIERTMNRGRLLGFSSSYPDMVDPFSVG